MTIKNLTLLFFIFCLCFSIVNIKAQSLFTTKKYPTNQFRNPLNKPFSLVGNFGECRPNHFHSGIDIRTDGKENYPVHAIDNGYISRVKIEAGGFGNAIYISHAGGYTSVYAHLNKFYPELENYIRKKQYQNKSWNIDITFAPHDFLVRKGSFIAYSGNTGSSQGPHLHLEIRDTKTDAPLNPLLFFEEIKDDKKPLIKQIAIYDGNKSIYEQKPTSYKITNGNLPTNIIKINSSKAYIGINGDDYMAIATGTLGIYEMNLYINNEPYFAWQMDNINYDITRYMNAEADYKTKKNNGPWIQLCAHLPNDKLTIYNDIANKRGVIDLSDGLEKKIKIEVMDTKKNISTLNFILQGTNNNNKQSCDNEMIAGKKNAFKNQYIGFILNEDALYDNICFETSIKNSNKPYSFIYQVHFNDVPLHSYFDLNILPKEKIPDNLKNKIALIRLPFKNETSKIGTKATYENNIVSGSVREFGNYEIVIDQLAPTISTTLKDNTNISNVSKLIFTIKEESTNIKNCTANVDGQWLRIVQKGNNYYYEMDNYFPKGTHKFTISATDDNDNTNSKTFTFTK